MPLVRPLAGLSHTRTHLDVQFERLRGGEGGGGGEGGVSFCFGRRCATKEGAPFPPSLLPDSPAPPAARGHRCKACVWLLAEGGVAREKGGPRGARVPSPPPKKTNHCDRRLSCAFTKEGARPLSQEREVRRRALSLSAPLSASCAGGGGEGERDWKEWHTKKKKKALPPPRVSFSRLSPPPRRPSSPPICMTDLSSIQPAGLGAFGEEGGGGRGGEGRGAEGGLSPPDPPRLSPSAAPPGRLTGGAGHVLTPAG